MSQPRFALCAALAVAAATNSASLRAQEAAAAMKPGFDIRTLDRSASACDNFYQFACGGWLNKTEIPVDRSRWGRFSELDERNQSTLHDILEEASKDDPKRDAKTRQVGDSYAACMDEATIEKKGLSSIKPELDRIAALSKPKELPALVAHLHQIGVDVLFGFGSEQDFKKPQQILAIADQGGLGLPDRDYYFKEDDKSKETRDKYVAHVTKMFALAGETPEAAAAAAKSVMTFETALAQASKDLVSRRDPASLYHPTTRKDLDTLTPHFSWAAYFKAVEAPEIVSVNVTTPDFFKAFDAAIASTDIGAWRTYLEWQTLTAAAPLLTRAFVDENFAFFGQALTGAKELRPRWKRCADRVDTELGEALGQAFIDRRFGPDGKARMLTMVEALEKSLQADIKTLPWMSDPTKVKALEKLAAFGTKIGYPDTWRDYSSVKITRDDAIGNSKRATAFEFARQLAKIGKPLDRKEWGMTPPTVNAGYHPLRNDINFPAGILQPPFFDKEIDDAVNFGAIGAVIGHEMTHGFDDQGRQFAADGSLTDWWTAEDGKEFEKRASCVEQQYGEYTAVDDIKLNGKLTLGENVADNGGVRVAYAALLDTLSGKKVEPIDGFTPEQRFFLGYGQIWCEKQRPEMARLRAQVDVHANAQSRVNGVVSNMAEFAKAFACAPKSPMVRENACRVW